ncbi:HAD family hydrolase [Neoroseomonas nitratireducens]|nr:HAD family hydrolase [Neoroseomonas nitratireducens]
MNAARLARAPGLAYPRRMERLLVFDLDGTLVDSAPDIHAALNRVLVARGLAPYDLPAVKAMIGDGARVLLERAFGGRGQAFEAAALDVFLADEDISQARLTAPFPGIAPAMDSLAEAGWRFAVCTNKPEGPARALLASLGLGGRFAAIGGGDSFPVRKPDPGHLLATIAAAGGKPGAAVMVGDHRNDVRAAAGAGLPCIFAAWGYGPHEMAEGAPIAAAPSDLPRLAAALRG